MDVVTFCQSDLPHVSFAVFEDMRRKGKFCDLTLNVGNHSFKAHRNIVAAAIPYFESVFLSNGTELKEEEFEVEDLDPIAVESLIDFAYTGKVDISPENVKSLLVASLFLHLNQVRDACVQFLTERLNVHNVAEIRTFASNVNNSDFVQNCDTWICKNFEEFSKCDDFLNLPHSCIKATICKDDLNVPNEEVVFEAVVRWVQNSPTERIGVFPDLLPEIRMTYLSKEYFIDKVVSEELIKNSVVCKDFINEVKNYLISPRLKSCLTGLKTSPRNLWKRIWAVGSCTSCGFSVHHFDVGNQTWYPLAVRREDFGAVRSVVGVNEKIYIFLDERIVTFSVKFREWEVLKPKHKEIEGAAVVLYGDKIYFFGSFNSNSRKKIRCFDSLHHKWLKEELFGGFYWSYAAAASDGKFIYLTGGFHRNFSYTNATEKYVPSTGEVFKAARMMIPRGKHSSSSPNGKVYVCGGYTNEQVALNTAAVYDPNTDQWNCISPMTNSLCNFSLVLHHNKLYALGKTSSEIYDTKRDEWEYCTPANEGFVGAVSLASAYPKW